jgi:hypothetical protein
MWQYHILFLHIYEISEPLASFTATQNGSWNDPATWGGSGPPSSADDVIIPAGITVTLSNDAACNDITIEGGLTISGSDSLQVYGNWINNGTFNANNSTVDFTGNTNASITGTSTTVFRHFKISKTPDTSTIVNINSNVTISGQLKLYSGLISINSGANVDCTFNTGFTIRNLSGILINGGIFNTGNFSIVNNGLFRISSGTASIGTSSGNSLQTATGGSLIVEGGTFNIAGRLVNTAGAATITGGTINISTVGHTNADHASFHISANTNLTISNDAQIIIHKPNNGTRGDIYIISGGSGIKSITGGTFVMGGNLTEPNSVFVINSPFAIHNLTINDHNNPSVSITGNDLTINGILTMNGGYIDTGSQSLIILNNSTDAISHTSGYIIGNLRRSIAGSGNATYIFPTGVTGSATPIELAFTGLTGSGTITVSSVNGDHPQIGSSLLNVDKSLNSHWVINNNGVTFTGLDATLNFGSGVFDAGINTTSLVAGAFDGASWSYPSVTGSTASTITCIWHWSYSPGFCIGRMYAP